MENYEKAEQDYMSGMKYKDIAEKYGTTITNEEGEHQAPTPKWLMALLYAVFYTCHEQAAEKIDFMHFIMSFSSKEFQDAISWYYKAYAEREGILPADEDETAKTCHKTTKDLRKYNNLYDTHS